MLIAECVIICIHCDCLKLKKKHCLTEENLKHSGNGSSFLQKELITP